MLSDFVVDIVDVFLLQVGWLAQRFILSRLVLLE